MKTINGQQLKQLFLSGANNLYNHYPEVDQLNVFPVPDGDTGMNMNLTLTSGSKEIQNCNDESVETVARLFSRGLMMGARGNSGVITSQIFKGFSESCKGKNRLTVRELADAFMNGKVVAYKAVKNPVEGTILTVIRESSAALLERFEKEKISTIEAALDILLQEAKKSLKHTPDLLPVLKQVGVVDSGGAGLTLILEGMDKAAKGRFVERIENLSEGEAVSNVLGTNDGKYAGAELSESEEGYGYCTQMLIRLGKPGEGKKAFDEERFKNFLANHGKSLVFVRDDDLVKVHVHTLTPGMMLNFAQQYGEFLTITIENMSEEHHNIEHGDKATDMAANIERNRQEKAQAEQPWKETGIVAVSSGEGLDEMFKELGVDVLVSGGQTMNPSTQDFLDAIQKCHAHNVFILPNNSNIVLAATQACDVMVDDPNIHPSVIPSKSIPQGLTALMQYSSDLEPDEAYDAMKSALKTVRSGSVTYAIKDTDIDGVHITKGYYMAMRDDKKLIACVPDKYDALRALLKDGVNENSAVATIIAGKDVPSDQIESLQGELQEAYPDIEVNLVPGGQPVYSFLVGIE
jgi:hypothetical protein